MKLELGKTYRVKGSSKPVTIVSKEEFIVQGGTEIRVFYKDGFGHKYLEDDKLHEAYGYDEFVEYLEPQVFHHTPTLSHGMIDIPYRFLGKPIKITVEEDV